MRLAGVEEGQFTEVSNILRFIPSLTTWSRSAVVRRAIAEYTSSIVTQLLFSFDGGVLLVQSVLSLLGELLVGTAEEVTPVVRGNTYRAILSIVKHYAVDLLAKNCTLALELVQRGVSDKDRSSRLLAGYVFIEF